MSNFREALRIAVRKGIGIAINPAISPIEQAYGATDDAVNEIASRYGDLEFTREEVRGMLEEAIQRSLYGNNVLYEQDVKVTIDEILSRHTEGEANRLDPKEDQT